MAESSEITLLYRRLLKLREQKALLGISADPSIDIEIEDIEAKLGGTTEIGDIFSLVETERIQDAAAQLLGELAHFQHWTIRDIEQSSGRPIAQVYTTLKTKCYDWQQVIWSKLNTNNRGRVMKIRKRLDNVHTPDDLSNKDTSDVPNLVDEIMSLSQVANVTKGSTVQGKTPDKQKLQSSLIQFCTEVKVRTETIKNQAHGQRSLAENIAILVKKGIPLLPEHIEQEKWQEMREMVGLQHSRSYQLFDELDKLYSYICDYCDRLENG